ncbi:hypothetical protein GPU89_31245 [Burkholderia cepacia]|nr:hypothetical protein [Burkholderia cepacia]
MARLRKGNHACQQGLDEVAHCIGDRRDERNEIKSTERFRESPMLAKCKAASRESLTPLKRDRVNQHKAIDYFLHRSRASIFKTHLILLIFMSNFCIDRSDRLQKSTQRRIFDIRLPFRRVGTS